MLDSDGMDYSTEDDFKSDIDYERACTYIDGTKYVALTGEDRDVIDVA